MSDAYRSGFVSLVGKPNIGKSTLVNRLVGQKVSITSRRPQTTRHRILGIRTEPASQMILVDTPGLHGNDKKMLNRVINRTARNSLADVDVLVLMINATGWNREDELPLGLAREQGIPVVLAINKVDRLKDKSRLLPLIDASRKRHEFAEIVPISALSGYNVEELYGVVRARLPEAPQCFPEGQFTDKSNEFVVAELVREQLFRQLGEELPYVTAVKIEKYTEDQARILIEANIWVEKAGHKGIIIGKNGERLKAIGSNARMQIERFVDKKVHLELWVKVRKGWRDDINALEGLGYSEG